MLVADMWIGEYRVSGGVVAVFVLVHGAWGGGWQWQPIARKLRDHGHDVHAPTLTGLGDRAHVAPVPLTLSLHVRDVVDLLFFDDLHDVVLVGCSYGGSVVAGVADLATERVGQVVSLDGEVAREGRSLIDGFDDETRAELADRLAAGERTGWIPPPTADDMTGELKDRVLREWVGARERPQPYGTWAEPYPDNAGRRWSVPHTYLSCTDVDWEEEPEITALRHDPRWRFRELPLNHLGLLYAPEIVTQALLDVLGD